MSKKILLKGILAVSATIALSIAPSLILSDFEDNQVKAEFLKKDIPSSEKLGSVYFENVEGKKYNTKDLIENKISGAFLHPYKKDEIMVVSFQDDKEKELKTDKSRHKKITEDLIELDSYDLENSNFFKSQEEKASGSFHLINEHQKVDYNAVSVSVKQIESIEKRAIEEGLSKNAVDKIARTIIFHELAHSHNIESDQRVRLIEEFEKQKSVEDKELFHKHIGSKEVYRAENYADSFSLLVGAKEDAKIDNSSFDDFNEFSTFFKNVFRNKKDLDISHFNKHETRATIEVTNNFIKENWDILNDLSIEELEDIARIITDKTLNNILVKNYNKDYENQKKLIDNNGYSEEELNIIKKDVQEGTRDLIINVIVNDKLMKKVNNEKLNSLIEELDKKEHKKLETKFKLK